MNEPECTINSLGDRHWRLNGKRHRTDGPASEYATGDKRWYLNGEKYTEKQHAVEVKKLDTCDGKVVVIEGKKYKLTAV